MQKFISKTNKNSIPVSILKDNGSFLTMSDGTNVKKEAFSSNYDIFGEIYEDNITSTAAPENSLLNGFLDQIKKIDTSKVIDSPEGSSVVINDTDKTASAKPVLLNNVDLKNPDVSQYKVYANEDEVDVDSFLNNKQTPKNQQNIQQTQSIPQTKKSILNENGLTIDQENYRQEQITLTGIDPYENIVKQYKEQKSRNMNQSVQPTQNIQTTIKEEENDDHKFFKRIKRSHDVSLKININDKIGDPSYVRLTAINMEGDIIDFYTKEIMKSILSDSNKFEKLIYEQLKEIILPESKKSKKVVKTIKKTSKVKNEEIKENKVIVPDKPVKKPKKVKEHETA